MNKKALYESIMKNVAKEVKKTLNEKVIKDKWNTEETQTLEYLKKLYSNFNIDTSDIKEALDNFFGRSSIYMDFAEYAMDSEERACDLFVEWAFEQIANNVSFAEVKNHFTEFE